LGQASQNAHRLLLVAIDDIVPLVVLIHAAGQAAMASTELIPLCFGQAGTAGQATGKQS
jgi:hypothetical protein